MDRQSTVDQLRAEAERLKQQLEALTLDDPPADPKELAAHHRRLLDLGDDYRQTLAAIQRQENADRPRPAAPQAAAKPAPVKPTPPQKGVPRITREPDYPGQLPQAAQPYDQVRDGEPMDAGEAERLRLAAANHALDKARLDWQQQQAQLREQVAAGNLSREAAVRQATEARARVTDLLTEQTNLIRSRGDDLEFLKALASTGTNAAVSVLPYLTPTYQLRQYDHLMRGGDAKDMPPTEATPPPFGDMSTLPARIAEQAQAQLPPTPVVQAQPPAGVNPYQLPGVPTPEEQRTRYVLP